MRWRIAFLSACGVACATSPPRRTPAAPAPSVVQTSPPAPAPQRPPRPPGRFEAVNFDEVGAGKALSSETQEQAVARAREDALSKAMMGAADVFYGFSDYAADIGREHHESVARYLFLSNQGVITDMHASAPECAIEDRITTCRVRVRGVISFRGEMDPSFALMDQQSGRRLGLDRRQYYDGEPVTISVAATKDSYLYLFSWDTEDNLYIIFPNQAQKDNRLKAGQALELPEAGSGAALRARLPEGRDKASERLLAVASLKELIAPATAISGQKTATMPELAHRLSELERSEWTLQVIPYEIVKR